MPSQGGKNKEHKKCNILELRQVKCPAKGGKSKKQNQQTTNKNKTREKVELNNKGQYS